MQTTYKCIGDVAHEYLYDFILSRKSSQRFMSSSQILLQTPAFSVAVLTLWNRFSADIRNAVSLKKFKSVLKTHLFNYAFTNK